MKRFEPGADPSTWETARSSLSVSRARHESPADIEEAITAFRAGGPVLIHDAEDREGETDLEYDERSSFSLTVNHRDTYTGITDEDRALTISTIGGAASSPDSIDFSAAFRTPGHVHLLRGAPDLLADRQGHTELGLALTGAADLPPAVVVCEMLDNETGRALPPAAAKAYAVRNDVPYVEGIRLIERLG
ncbi:3,4-dihydroxy-2-butanone-4-phosphate synthase [Natrialbaceae archaeon A-gly3]